MFQMFQMFQRGFEPLFVVAEPQGFGTLLHSKDMLDKSESFLERNRNSNWSTRARPLQSQWLTKNLAVEKSLLESGMDDIPRMIPSGNLT